MAIFIWTTPFSYLSHCPTTVWLCQCICIKQHQCHGNAKKIPS